MIPDWKTPGPPPSLHVPPQQEHSKPWEEEEEEENEQQKGGKKGENKEERLGKQTMRKNLLAWKGFSSSSIIIILPLAKPKTRFLEMR